MGFKRYFLLSLFLLTQMSAAWSAELIMIEQEGCVYCEKFNREIAVAYPKTAEGKRAPLRRLDLHKPWPASLSSIAVERLTPTFILVDKQREIARLRGYPGDEHFWVLLNEMLQKLDVGS